ncbi:MAG: hypothetical protein IT289_10940 [Oligoflexia bacterium]|nr:hypothetical protein [Oligoflexia bacterium]
MMHRKSDPLVKILERYLLQVTIGEKLSNTMIEAIVAEYLEQLNAQGVHIPGPVRNVFIQDIKEEIKDLATQATLGAISTEDQSESQPRQPRKAA